MKYIRLTPTTTLDDLQRQYRHWAMRLHPDKGGKSEDFIQLQRELKQAIAELDMQSEHTGTTPNDLHIMYRAIVDVVNAQLMPQIRSNGLKTILGGVMQIIDENLKSKI